MTAESPSKLVRLARIGAAHGIRGEVRVRSFTEDPLAFGHYGPLRDEAGGLYTVRNAREQKGVVVTRFEEITDRNAAERLNGTDLFVAREALGEGLEDGEWFAADLVGLEVRSPDGNAIGSVVAVHDFGAGDILEVRFGGGRSEMFAFTETIVPDLNVAEGWLVLVPPPEVSERETDEPQS